MNPLDEFLTRNAFTTERKVYWGEMDALGHVNNTQYIRYFEDIRTEFFMTHLGNISLEDYSPVVAEITCRFLAPVIYPDTLILGLSVRHIGNSQIQHYYEIFSESQNRCIATGADRVVNVDKKEGKKADIPVSYKDIFAKYLISE